MVKEFFKKNSVEHVDYNVATDQKRREEMIAKSHQMGVPVIDIDGEIIVGFNRPEIERALKLK